MARLGWLINLVYHIHLHEGLTSGRLKDWRSRSKSWRRSGIVQLGKVDVRRQEGGEGVSFSPQIQHSMLHRFSVHTKPLKQNMFWLWKMIFCVLSCYSFWTIKMGAFHAIFSHGSCTTATGVKVMLCLAETHGRALSFMRPTGVDKERKKKKNVLNGDFGARWEKVQSF